MGLSYKTGAYIGEVFIKFVAIIIIIIIYIAL